MIPDTSTFVLNPDLILDIKTAITDLPVVCRYNERQIINKKGESIPDLLFLVNVKSHDKTITNVVKSHSKCMLHI